MSQLKLNLKGVKAAIFDMDGTMINNAMYHKTAWQDFLKKHNITLSENEFKEKVSGKKNDQILELLFGNELSKEDVKAYAEEKEAIYRDLYELAIQEVEGLSKIINELSGLNVKLAIATTAPAANRQFALHSLSLEGKFEVILGDEHVTKGKPDPEIYLSTALELKVTPNECIVFEDSPPGVKAGKDAGMIVIGVSTSHTSDELHAADYTVNDFTEITFI